MGFFDSLKKGLQQQQVKFQKDMQRKATQVLKEKGSSLSAEQKTRLEKISKNVVATNKSATNSSKANSSSKKEKTINEWEGEWRNIGVLANIDLSPFSSSVGIYKATLSGIVVYIGRAVEFKNGGFRKRLSDYRRKSDSARKHKSGKLMYEHADRLHISIISTGSDSEAVTIAKNLERMLVAKYNPEWNTMLKNSLM
jgi:hypothetical protein